MSDKPEEKTVMQGKISSYKNYTNEELIFDFIKEHKTGCQGAYNQLMENTLESVEKYVSRREKNKNNREEIIQEIMFQIIRTERVYKYTGKKAKWTTYLLKFILGWYNENRKKEAERRENEPAVFDDNKNMDVYEDKPFDVVYSKTETERLMQHLDDKQKEIIKLRFYFGWTLKEIGDNFNYTKEWAYQQIDKIRKIGQKLNGSDQPGGKK